MAKKALFRFVLDHIPIVLSLEEFSEGPRPLFFFNILCDSLDLRELVGFQVESGVIQTQFL